MKGLATIVFIFVVGGIFKNCASTTLIVDSESAYANGADTINVAIQPKVLDDTIDVAIQPKVADVPINVAIQSKVLDDTIDVAIQSKVLDDTIYVAIQPKVADVPINVENQKLLNEINGLRNEILNNKGDTISWWLSLITIVLGFFAFIVPLAGYFAFKKFKEIEADAKEASGRIDEIKDKAQQEFEKIKEEGYKEIERLKKTTRETLQNTKRDIADTPSPQSVKLNKKYTAAWIVWTLCVVVAEFFVPDGWYKTQLISWIFCAIYFVALEAVAILRTEKRSTFSEQVWRFYKNKTAHIPLLIGGIGWICSRLFGYIDIAGLDLRSFVAELDVGHLFLIIGIVGYLLLYIYSGRKG